MQTLTGMLQLPFPQAIDNTMRKAFASCGWQFYAAYLRRKAKTEANIHLHFGATFAHGCEKYRQIAYMEQGVSHDETLCRIIPDILAYWGDTLIPSNHANKSRETCILALDAYFTEYPPYHDGIIPYFDASGTLATEYNFTIPLDIAHPVTRQPIIYCGRFDFFGYYNGPLFLIDEKTTNSLGKTWLNQWDLASQFIGYTWACRHLGIDVKGAIIRGTSILSKSFGHAEVILPIPEWKVERWYEQLITDIQAMITSYKSGNFSLNLGESCNAYGGCEFRDACNTNDPEKWLDALYVDHLWDPAGIEEDAEDLPLSSLLPRG